MAAPPQPSEVTFCRFRMTRSANAQHFRCLPFRPAQAGTVRLSSPSLLRSGAPSVPCRICAARRGATEFEFNFLRTSGQKNRFYVRLNIFNFRFLIKIPCGQVLRTTFGRPVLIEDHQLRFFPLFFRAGGGGGFPVLDFAASEIAQASDRQTNQTMQAYGAVAPGAALRSSSETAQRAGKSNGNTFMAIVAGVLVLGTCFCECIHLFSAQVASRGSVHQLLRQRARRSGVVIRQRTGSK